MFESFKNRRHGEHEKPEEQITPVEGLEHTMFSLPERDEDGTELVPHDDWIMTAERSSDNATLHVDLARYTSDGTIERRHNLPADLFQDFQHERQAQLRFQAARDDLGISAVRASIVDMVRNSDTYAEWKPVEDAALATIAEVRIKRVQAAREFFEDHNRTIPRIKPENDPRVPKPRH